MEVFDASHSFGDFFKAEEAQLVVQDSPVTFEHSSMVELNRLSYTCSNTSIHAGSDRCLFCKSSKTEVMLLGFEMCETFRVIRQRAVT